MNEATYTPGPWGLPDGARASVSAMNANGSWNGLIATVDAGDYARSKAEGMANARLIAAAPDLLEALKELVDYNGGAASALDDEYVMERVFAAIAKAEGTS